MAPCFDAHSHLSAAPLPPGAGPRVICGTQMSDWAEVLAQAARDPREIPMLGLHPWNVPQADHHWSIELETLLKLHSVGVGECGLDFAHRGADIALQSEAFRIQLRMAHRHHRPLAIHAVHAWAPLLTLLREEGVPPAGALVHAFSGSADTARTLQQLGVFLSFSGALLDERRSKLHAALRAVEARWLLLETDGQADLAEVLAGAARLRGVPEADLAAQTWENGQRCFKELLA